MSKYFFLFFISIFLFFCQNLFSQEGLELSRKDSADVEKLITGYLHYDEIGNLKESTNCLNAIADIYWKRNQSTNAIEYFLKSLERNKKLESENAIAMISNNLALIYSDIGEYSKSEEFFRQTLKYRRTQKTQIESLTSCLINLSNVLLKTGKYDEAASVIMEAVEQSKSANDMERLQSCYGTLAEIYVKKGDKQKEKEYFAEYIKYNQIVTNRTQQKYLDEKDRAKLAEYENLLKQNELLLKEKELVEKDEKLDVTESKLKISKEVSQGLLFNLNQEQLRTQVLEREAKIQELEEKEKSEKFRNIIILFIIASIFMIVVALILYNAYRQKKEANNELAIKNAEIEQQNEEIIAQRDNLDEQNKEIEQINTTLTEQRDSLNDAYNIIEQKNEKITKSIDYAGMIQRAMLARPYPLSSLVKDSFILFLPRDIVSGDFYWYLKIKDIIVIAAIDCTGHGVPGALLSMVGNDLLNKAVIGAGITNPDEILNELDAGVVTALNQEQSEINDGMDIAICTIDYKKNTILFAGANNPLVIIQDNKLKRIRGDFFPIGKDQLSKKTKKFTLHQEELKKDTRLYIFSDGYSDQNSGDDFKKFGLKQMEELLFKNHKKTMAEQLSILKNTHEAWKGENEQLDDIVIIGLQL